MGTFRDTTLGGRLHDVDAIYGAIADAQALFRASAEDRGAPVACPPGCGACCTTFIPDVMPLEAQRLAHFILAEKPGAKARLESFQPALHSGCPFWDEDRPGENCTVYPARPLICRLFGFSAVRGKSGGPEFSLCRHMAGHAGIPRRLSGDRIAEAYGRFPPHMADFAGELAALDPHESGRRLSLPEALEEAIPRVAMALHYLSFEHGEEPPGSEPDRSAGGAGGADAA